MTITAPQFRDLGVAIVAPSGYAPDDVALSRGIALLESAGCRVHNYYSAADKFQRFGAPDQARADQLHAAARDPDIQLIICLRGGYGMSRLLPLLDLDLLANSGKFFVGHSDFTALQMALLAHANTITFCGPMLCSDLQQEPLSAFTMQHFWECVTAAACALQVDAAGNPWVDVQGRLWGGNLAMITHLAGTPYLPRVDGGILFVEDINEHPYRVERMLLQLHHAGVLAGQQALVLGDFSGYSLTEYDNGYDADAMLTYLRSILPIPVLTGLPFGHIKDKVTLPVGCLAHLTSDRTGFHLRMRDYPFLGADRVAPAS